MNIRTQKIKNTILNIYKIVIAALSMIDHAKKIRFFKKMILIANVSPNIVLKFFFLICIMQILMS